MCIHPECKKIPTFNTKGEKALYCANHKMDGMVDVKNKTCITEGCRKIPHYNMESNKALYCADHKTEGMINVVSKTCLKCKKRPTFNIEGEKALYCATHKQNEMINVVSKTCIKCKKRPTFNIEGEKALYCATHKQNEMINVVSKTCLKCKKQPKFNMEGKKALYCATHKQNEMINVVNKTCLECNKQPNFNMEGKKALYCSDHKTEGMVDVKSKTCLECNKQPKFNKEGETKALYCATHKQNNMIDVVNKTCKSEWCLTQVHTKYDGYCLFCYMNLFPDKPVSRNYKTKEYSVVEYVKTKFPLSWVADKRLQDGCSKRRPDLVADLGYQVIIIEVDENQHINYDCSCQNKRTMELSQDVGHRPIVFIRFNPDDYENGKKITSCWSRDKNGICVIKKKTEWTQRLNALEETINYWINPENTTNKTIETIHLFYDV